jgi:pantoate--beta-alanine ligase
MSLRLLRTVDHVREFVRGPNARGQSVGLVPTMGALHRGHMRLIECARADNDVVVVSVFVNPIQFNQSDDYTYYPRTLDADLQACESAAVDAVFAPPMEEMYPEPIHTTVEVARESQGLCGNFRPGHFRGVATVVMKLFNIIQADKAYFGEKDAQQLAVISRMVRDLNIPVQIVPVETVRERDGLALSSRNAHLTHEQRQVAPLLYHALEAAAESIRAGGDVLTARNTGLNVLSNQPLLRVEYFEVVDANTMQPVASIAGATRIAAAAWIGNTRLIDNVRV